LNADCPAPRSTIEINQECQPKKVIPPESAVHALKGIDLRVDQGEFRRHRRQIRRGEIPLLNMITAWIISRPGEVIVRGNGEDTSVHKLNEDALALWRGTNPGHHLPILSAPADAHIESKM